MQVRVSTRPLLCRLRVCRFARWRHAVLDLSAKAICAHRLLLRPALLRTGPLAISCFPKACSVRIHSGRTGRCRGRRSAAPVRRLRLVVCCLPRSAWAFGRHQDRGSRRICSFVRSGAPRGLGLAACLFPSNRTTAFVSIAFSSELCPYLYAGVLGAEVDGAVVGRVCDAEDVSDVVGRPQRVEVLEGRCAPDLVC